MRSPVALIIFNRPDYTARVLDEIAKVKPEKLFVIADGPRDKNNQDEEKCAAARRAIERVDWGCEVIKNYSDINLGCGKRPASGISWVFDHVESAIILEDDCVPNPCFFRFCDELLERYFDDERIMQICGNNFQFGQRRTGFSYYFSRYSICWGWATWRRAWKHHDMKLRLWPELKESNWLSDIIGNQIAVDYWKDKFEKAYKRKGEIDFWDYQWSFACWSQNGLSIMPNETLVSNIGCGPNGTHTKNPNIKTANLPRKEISFPLQHPPCVTINFEADNFFIENVVVPKHSKRMKHGLIHRVCKKIFLKLSSFVKVIISK